MNIAVVHPYPVHAAAVGGVTRVYELVCYLARRHEVSVFTHQVPGSPADSTLARAGVAVHACPLPAAGVGRKIRGWLGPAPYYVSRNANPALAAEIGRADAARAFDVVHVELGYMAPALAGVGRHAIRVLAEQEAMPLVLERLRRVPWLDRTAYERLAVFTAGKVERFDRETLPHFDLLYGITPREQEYLSRASRRPSRILPHVVRMDRFPAAGPGTREAHAVLFVGNFAHRPNVHAAHWFVERVWPIVRAAAPLATFHVVGAGLTDDIRQRLTAPGVELRGYQADLPACYRRAAVMVNPVHSGGGMRGKVLEASASGCAVVSTTTGLDGIAAVSGQHCLAADTSADFAAAVIRYLDDAALRAAHGEAARALVAELYDAHRVFSRLEADYEQACEARAAVRTRTIA